MVIKSIFLSNYRNYESETVQFCPGTNIIYGKNAQGKTNLLEGVYIFSSGKSYRALQDKELVKSGSDFGRVKITFEAFGRENECEIIFKEGKKKIVRHNKIPLQKTSELLGLFKVTLFGPSELSLVSGSPEGRRQFMDIHISSSKPVYYKLLKDYIRLVRQKNNLLKKIQLNEANTDMLSVWNEKIAETGAGIIYLRNQFIEKLSPVAEKIHSEITRGSERLSINYLPNTSFDDLYDKEKIKNQLFMNIQKKERAEINQGQALAGPHRDDVEFYVNSYPLKAYGSQGQQRTAVIALKCAQTELIYDECGEYPILLLDDIFSELDAERRRFLTEKIKNMQVILTCTEPDIIKGGNDKKYFYIENGKIYEKA